MRDDFICDAVRTPIGQYGGALVKVRTDDLAAVPIWALIGRNPKADWPSARHVGRAPRAHRRARPRKTWRQARLGDHVGGHRAGCVGST